MCQPRVAAGPHPPLRGTLFHFAGEGLRVRLPRPRLRGRGRGVRVLSEADNRQLDLVQHPTGPLQNGVVDL